MTMAHVGLGVLVPASPRPSAWQSEAILVMKPGERAELAGYSSRSPASTKRRARTTWPARDVRRQPATARRSPRCTPEKRFYPVERRRPPRPGSTPGCWRDLYVVLGDPVEGRAAGRAYRAHLPQPAGHVDLGRGRDHGLAGLLSLTDRRLRVGAPRPARAAPGRGAEPEHRRRWHAAAGSCSSCRSCIFVGVGIGLAVGLTRDPSTLPSALIGKPAPEFALPPLEGRDGPGFSQRRSQGGSRCWSTCSRPGACRAGSSTRCCRRWPSRASRSTASTTRTRPEDATGLAGRARRPVPRSRRRPRRPGRDRLGRLRRAGNLRDRSRGAHPYGMSGRCSRAISSETILPLLEQLEREQSIRCCASKARNEALRAAGLLCRCTWSPRPPRRRCATNPDEILEDPALEAARPRARARSCAVSSARTSRSTIRTPTSPAICGGSCASSWSPAERSRRSSAT